MTDVITLTQVCDPRQAGVKAYLPHLFGTCHEEVDDGIRDDTIREALESMMEAFPQV